MEILGYAFALIVGLVIGLMGSGGSILCVPIFVYLFKSDATNATALSLFVVGVTSAVGAVSNIINKNVHLKNSLYFGIPSVLSVGMVRRFVLPILPNNFFHLGSFVITKDIFILTLFAVLMIISAVLMIRKKQNKGTPNKKNKNPSILLTIQGLGVGALTGLIGAGGGFLIIPALVLLADLDMKQAIGTSLLIVSMNSLFGFASSLSIAEINWKILLLFTSISIAGIFIGLFLSKRMNGAQLKPAFGWFVLIVGTFIIFKELVFNNF